MSLQLPVRSLDYVVIFARQWQAMRDFYEQKLGFPLYRELGPQWIELCVDSNRLALMSWAPVSGNSSLSMVASSLQLGFRVAQSDVDTCVALLKERGVKIRFEPGPWGNRALFFNDPDGNVLELYADTEPRK